LVKFNQLHEENCFVFTPEQVYSFLMFSVEELGQEIAELALHIDAATHRLLECVRRFDEEKGWAEEGAVSCAHWLAWRIGLDPTTAREKVRVARALGTLPAIDGALKVGKLSYAKVRALTRIATPASEATLLELALVATGAELERLCRCYRNALVSDGSLPPAERSVSRRELPGGMVKLEIVLQPDEADFVLKALDKAREVSSGDKADAASAETQTNEDENSKKCEAHWPNRADGIVALAESYLAGHMNHGNGGERFQLMVRLDQDVLAPDGVYAATLGDGTRLSAEALRRVACDCGIVTLGSDENRTALSIGRRSRSIPSAIRRSLTLRDRGCCFPGCSHERFLHGHHIQHWLYGGETSLENLVLLCTHHHHLVHEGGWSVARTSDGPLVFTAPSGRLFPAIAVANEAIKDSLEFLHEWAEGQGLDLGADANMPLWDGTRPDYDWAVGAMLASLTT
jgi:hypothetical protein